MKKPIYFIAYGDYPEFAYPIEYWKEYMEENELYEIKLSKAVIEYNTEYFFCREFHEVGLKENSGCGKDCEKYSPRNGKNGRCKHSANCYTRSDEEIVLKNQNL